MKKSFLKAVALGAAMSFFVASSGFAAGGSVVTGNISVYKGGELVSTLSGQNPIEDGVLFTCQGRCMVKSEGISLIGSDGAKIAVDSADDTFNLYIKEGKVEYTITNNSRTITFVTPDGAYSVADVVFDAASQSVVKGSVVVDAEGATHISVTEGKLVFATADGMQAVTAGNKIILAVNPDAAAAGAIAGGSEAAAVGGAAAGGATIGGVSMTAVAVAGAVVAGGVAVAVASSNDDDDDDKQKRPAGMMPGGKKPGVGHPGAGHPGGHPGGKHPGGKRPGGGHPGGGHPVSPHI